MSTAATEPATGSPARTPAQSPKTKRDRKFEVGGKRVYMIGIGGSGMSGLARMLQARGAIVSGSDQAPSEATQSLVAAGIPVGFEQTAAAFPTDTDLVVASAAIKEDHAQWMRAAELGVRVHLYAEALGECMIGSTGVSIAGTHGKSTTTAMLGCALTDAGLDPTVILGATSSQLTNGTFAKTSEPTGFRLGQASIPRGELAGRPGLLVAESCEFNRSFHNFHPTVACISSVEADHLDCYGTFEAVVESFREFAQQLPTAVAGGKLLIGHDNAHRREVTAGVDCQVQTIGWSPEADWHVSYDSMTRHVTVVHDRVVVGSWNNTVPGGHNAINAATAFVLATWLGADSEMVQKSLSNYRGIDRRLQLMGEKPAQKGEKTGVVRVFDDYGHHPTEIDITLRALREAERPQDRGGRLICVFQPHQHSRTRHLMEEFASSFSQADVVIVPEIYFVRDSEEEKQKVTSQDLVDRLRQKNVKANHLYPFGAIVEYLENLCEPNDVVVVMGAGPVWQVGRDYLLANA